MQRLIFGLSIQIINILAQSRRSQNISPGSVQTLIFKYYNECNYKVFTHSEWGPWSSLSLCSVSCGSGVQVRQRVCNYPPSLNPGWIQSISCPGDHVQYFNCQQRPCLGDESINNIDYSQ